MDPANGRADEVGKHAVGHFRSDSDAFAYQQCSPVAAQVGRARMCKAVKLAGPRHSRTINRPLANQGAAGSSPRALVRIGAFGAIPMVSTQLACRGHADNITIDRHEFK